MDIINPEILVRGKRYYRINPILNTKSANETPIHEYFDDEPCVDEEIRTCHVISKKGNDFCGSIYVPSMFICFVIGKGGEYKKRIEFDTKTIITVPKQGINDHISVRGKCFDSVDRALTRISMLVDTGRERTQFTHFLSIPAIASSIQQNFDKFKEAVLHNCVGDRGVEEGVFQRSFKLHVTICVLVLGDEAEVDRAVNICEEFRRENLSLFNNPLRVKIRGIDCMNDDACDVRVLYGKIDTGDDGERLQLIADMIVDFLVSKRVLLKRDYDRVTLHMTLMNANFSQEKDLGFDNFGDTKGKIRTIDCTNIMKKYSDWDFGSLSIEEIHLSKRLNIHPGSYYQSVGSLKFAEEK